MLTPYYFWKHDHAIHHATAGDLDRRGVGDVYTMTVQEYIAAPGTRSWLPIMRSPMIMFTIGSFFVFTLTHRSGGPRRQARTQQRI